MKKNKKTIIILLFFLFLIPIYNLSAEESESSLKKEIKQNTEQLNVLYDEVEKINTEIEDNQKEGLSIENNKKNIENNLKKNKGLITNILLFLQYYSVNDLWMLVLSSDNFITNVYLLDNIFKRFSNDLDKAVSQIKDLEDLEVSYNTNLNDLENKKSLLETEVSSYEKSYDELQVKLKELQKKEDFKLTTNSSAAIPQSSQDDLMSKAGIAPSDFEYADYIISIESSWNYTALNPYSGAYGLCQALPPEKMAQFGADWKNNPVTQLKFCNSYANSRYGSWKSAANFIKSNGWW